MTILIRLTDYETGEGVYIDAETIVSIHRIAERKIHDWTIPARTEVRTRFHDDVFRVSQMPDAIYDEVCRVHPTSSTKPTPGS